MPTAARTNTADAIPLLAVRALGARLGGAEVLRDVSFDVNAGETVALIGPNGAGKTTLLNALCGLVPVAAGDAHFDGRSLPAPAPHAVAARGVARTFQRADRLAELSVADAVLLGRHAATRGGYFADLCGLPGARRRERAERARIAPLLARLGLGDLAERPVATLSTGQQRRVALARALAAEPKLLLLDEPSAGLSPDGVAAFTELLAALRAERRLTLLLVEHNLRLVHALADRVVALVAGRVVAAGGYDAVLADPGLRAAYLGRGR